MLPALDFATQAKYHMFSSSHRTRFHDLHVAYQDLLKQMFFLIAFAWARGENSRSRLEPKIRQLRGLRWKPNQTTRSAVCDDAVSGFGENHPASIDVSHLAYHMLPASSSAPSQTILKVSLRCSESFCVRCELPGVIRVTDTHTHCRRTSYVEPPSSARHPTFADPPHVNDCWPEVIRTRRGFT